MPSYQVTIELTFEVEAVEADEAESMVEKRCSTLLGVMNADVLETQELEPDLESEDEESDDESEDEE